MPPWARNLAASLRGYYLSRWRYDAQTEKLVEETLEKDHWSNEKWNAWEAERLAFLLERAATKVPFYREQWAERRRNGDQSSPQYLENWRVLEKQTLRERGTNLVADDCEISKMYRDNTSGTTGKSIYLWSKAETVKRWYAIFEARCRRWYGISKNDRWAILGGQLVTPFEQKKPPFWVWNAGLKQLYMSAYHLSPELTKHYLTALRKYEVRYVLGYSAAIYSLAQEVLRSGFQIKLAVAVTNAEPLYEYQRAAIEEAFQCPVRESYGMAEIAAAASECDYGRLHIWRDTGIIQIDPASREDSGAGELLCTGLVNADMPLIKYRVGDYGKLSDEKCVCGRNLPLLAGIDGRSDDLVYTIDGRHCSHLHLVLGGNLPIYEAQIIQEKLNRVKVLYIPDEGFKAGVLETLTAKIRSRMGAVTVVYEKVAQIPRSSRGKFKAVVCNLSDAEKAKVKAVRISGI